MLNSSHALKMKIHRAGVLSGHHLDHLPAQKNYPKKRLQLHEVGGPSAPQSLAHVQ